MSEIPNDDTIDRMVGCGYDRAKELITIAQWDDYRKKTPPTIRIEISPAQAQWLLDKIAADLGYGFLKDCTRAPISSPLSRVRGIDLDSDLEQQ